MSLFDYLHAAPKTELHVHLEGAIRPATLLTLAGRNGISLPADTEDGLRQWFAFRDFSHFAEIYDTISRCTRTRDDYDLVVYEFGAEMARQNVRYAEVTFSPSSHAMYGVPFDIYFGGLTRGRERAERDFGVRIRWVFDLMRNVSDRSTLHPKADYATGAAIDGMRDGVVALGLGGKEEDGPPEPFAPYFERARAAGLHSVPHAGEHAGPESVWGALRELGAERIEHGVRSVEDPHLIAHLVKHRIALDLCPTSNVCLGVCPDLAAHPLRRLLDAGVTVTINSDDPPLFNTTLNDEVATLAHSFDLDVDAIDEILLNGVRASFLPDDDKHELEAAFRAEMAALRAVHLPREPARGD
jgi:adenosine deaminase